MKKTLDTICLFFKVDMWQIRREDVSPIVYLCLMVLKRLVVTVKFFTTRSVTDLASALTYSTLLAIVPILAVVFAATGCRNHHWLCKFVFGAYQGRTFPRDRSGFHAFYRIDAY